MHILRPQSQSLIYSLHQARVLPMQVALPKLQPFSGIALNDFHCHGGRKRILNVHICISYPFTIYHSLINMRCLHIPSAYLKFAKTIVDVRICNGTIENMWAFHIRPDSTPFSNSY